MPNCTIVSCLISDSRNGLLQIKDDAKLLNPLIKIIYFERYQPNIL